MWRQTLSRGVLYLLSAEYSSNVRGLAGNLSDLTVASSKYDILLCSETLVSDICNTCRMCWFPVSIALSCCVGVRCLGPVGWLHTFCQPKFKRGCCEMLFFKVCGVRQNLYVCSLYRNADLDDRIFDFLLASMAAVQAEDIRASLLFVGDLNGHHQEWLGSTTTNRHGVAAFDFAIVSGFDQFSISLLYGLLL